MRKQLLTKMLLIAASLFVGTSAWGQTTVFSQDFTDKSPSSTNVEDYGFTASTSDASCTATVEGGQLKLFVAAKSNKDWNATATATFSAIGTGNVITFSCSWNPGGPTGTRPYSHLRLTDADGNAALSLTNNGQSKSLFINGNEAAPVITGNNDWRSGNNLWNVVATLNMTTKKIVSLTVTKSGASTPVVNQTNIAFQNDVTSISKFVFQTTKKSNYTVTSYLDNVSITYEAAASIADVTFKYEDNDGNSLSSLKADVVDSYTVGDAISGLINSSITSSFTNADGSIRYDYNTYTVSEDATTVPAGGATVTLKFTPKVKYNYTVKAKSGEITLKTLKSDFAYKDDEVYYHYNQVINYNGTLYQAASISSGYKTSFVLDSDDKEVAHSYSQPATPITNLVFLAEAEEIFTVGTGSSADTRCSMGAGGYATDKTEFITLPAGEYYLVLSNRCSGNRTGIHKFYKGSDEEPFFSADGNGYNATRESGLFTLTEPTTLYFQGGSNNEYVDWLYIYGTPKVTIAAAGWATLFTPLALDFSGTGLTAYTATCAGTTVTLTSVENVPANTGVVLKGAANTYNIPVIASSSTAQGDLKGSATDAKAFDESYNYYYLAMNGANAQFKKLTSGGSIAAGKAYLQLDKATPARELSVSFEEDVTAISSVELSQDKMQNEFFDLQGRRVAQPTKGLYIVNGKKIIIK